MKETLPVSIANTPDDGTVEFAILAYGDASVEKWVRDTFPREIKSGKVRLGFVDAETFKMGHAKNMAHRLATGDILCNLDADNTVLPEFHAFLKDTFSDGKHALVARTVVLDPARELVRGDGNVATPIPKAKKSAMDFAREGNGGRIAIRRGDFMRLRGYDEHFEGWGNEDWNFIKRAMDAGLEQLPIPMESLGETIRHSDEARVANLNETTRLTALESLSQIDRDERWWQEEANADGSFGCGSVYIHEEKGNRKTLFSPENFKIKTPRSIGLYSPIPAAESGHHVVMASLARMLQNHGYDVHIFANKGSIETFEKLGVGNAHIHAMPDTSRKTPDAATHEERLRILHNQIPQLDAMVFDTWPGRLRRHDDEILPVIKEARARNPDFTTYCVSRDITGKTDRRDLGETHAQYIDKLLVLADERFSQIHPDVTNYPGYAQNIEYLGFNDETYGISLPEPTKSGDVLVISGNNSFTRGNSVSPSGEVILGSYGEYLVSWLKAVIESKPHSKELGNKTWRFLLPADCPDNIRQELTTLAAGVDGGIVIDTTKQGTEYMQLFAAAPFVMSAGGNTVLMSTMMGKKNLSFPLIPQESQEQVIRCSLTAEKGLTRSMNPKDFSTPERLANIIDETFLEPAKPHNIHYGGTENAARIIAEELAVTYDLPIEAIPCANMPGKMYDLSTSLARTCNMR